MLTAALFRMIKMGNTPKVLVLGGGELMVILPDSRYRSAVRRTNYDRHHDLDGSQMSFLSETSPTQKVTRYRILFI